MAGGYPRKLSDRQLAEAKWAFENTPTTLRGLAERYHITKGSLQRWIRLGGWLKYVAPLAAADAARQAAAAFERDVQAEATAEHDAALIDGLTGQADKADKAGKAELPASVAGDQVPGDQPNPPVAADQAAPETALATPDVRLKAPKPPSAEVIAFPNARPAQREPEPTLFPMRSKAEQAELKVRLAGLRGVLAIQQIQQLERHEILLEDFAHLLSVYLGPHKYVDLAGLSAADAEDKKRELQRNALAMLAPTDKDSLAGAVKTLTSSLATVVALKRLVAGCARASARGPLGRDEDEEERGEPGSRLAELDNTALRTVQVAMALLTGQQAQQYEPPRPPPPEPLDDLRPPPDDPPVA